MQYIKMKNKLSQKQIKDLSIDDIVKITEALDRIEKKLDIALNIFGKPSSLNIKGYPAKNFDWTSKPFSFKTKGNSE